MNGESNSISIGTGRWGEEESKRAMGVIIVVECGQPLLNCLTSRKSKLKQCNWNRIAFTLYVEFEEKVSLFDFLLVFYE